MLIDPPIYSVVELDRKLMPNKFISVVQPHLNQLLVRYCLLQLMTSKSIKTASS